MQQKATGSVQQHGGDVSGLVGSDGDGPWVVVQKPRRQRKGKEKDAVVDQNQGKAVNGSINDRPKMSGSRFIALNDDIPELNKEIPIIIGVNEDENIKEA
ncbi:hypothetical protein L195_g059084, partial [Trifolium pratense]